MVFADDLQTVANISQIVGAAGILLAAAALWFAKDQISKAKTQISLTNTQISQAREQIIQARAQLQQTEKATRGQMMLSIDAALGQYNDIRDLARKAKWEPPTNEAVDQAQVDERRRVKQYMGVFERIEHLLSAELIEWSRVDELYGKRAELLLKRQNVRGYMKENRGDWEALISFHARLLSARPDLPPLAE